MTTNYKKILKFLISGITAATVEYSIFLALLGFANATLITAQTLSFTVGFIISFLLNKKWVFKSKGSIFVELPKYLILALINILLSNVAMWLLVDMLHIKNWLAKALVMAAVASWNYFIFQKIIFRNHSLDNL